MRDIWVKVAESGRLSLPADVRRRLGVERGGSLVLHVDEEQGCVTLLTAEAMVRRVQRLARELLRDQMPSVDEFLAERREEAGRQEAKMRRLVREGADADG